MTIYLCSQCGRQVPESVPERWWGRVCEQCDSGEATMAEKFLQIARARIQHAPEIVICAAVRDIGGTVIRCHRHHHGLAVLRERWASRSHNIVALEAEQGFVTSRNRYVDRREAMALQLAAGIQSVAPGGYRGEQLFSEDLY